MDCKSSCMEPTVVESCEIDQTSMKDQLKTLKNSIKSMLVIIEDFEKKINEFENRLFILEQGA